MQKKTIFISLDKKKSKLRKIAKRNLRLKQKATAADRAKSLKVIKNLKKCGTHQAAMLMVMEFALKDRYVRDGNTDIDDLWWNA